MFWLDLGLTYTVALAIMLLYHNRTDYGGGESVAFGSSVPLAWVRKLQHIVLFWGQESQSQFHCQKASIMDMSALTPLNVLCHWLQYKRRVKTKHQALLLVSYCLCVLISDTANIRQSTHALSQLENLHYKLRERRGSTGDERKRDREGEKWIGAERGRDTGRMGIRNWERNTDEDREKGGKGPKQIENSNHSASSLFPHSSCIPLHYLLAICALLL